MTRSKVDLRPTPLDILFTDGDPINILFHFDRDVSAYSFRAQIRESYSSGTAIEFTFDTADAADGDVLATVAADDVTGIGRGYVWDLEWWPTADETQRRTIFAGHVNAGHQVSQ